jgi:hypothetical protein
MTDLFRSLICLTAVSLSVFACGGGKNEPTQTNPTVRSGSDIKDEDVKYSDFRPSLSSNGTKLVFVSGKGRSELRTVLATRTIGSAFSAPSRIDTGSIFLSEIQAKISPNGSHVLICGFSSAGRSLAICDISGNSCTRISTQSRGTDSFAFSPDSSGFYYLEGSSSSSATLKVATVAAPSSPFQIGVANNWIRAFWAPVASGFSIVAMEPTTSQIGFANLKSYTFATIAGAVGATSTSLTSNISENSILNLAIFGGSAGTIPATTYLASIPHKVTTETTITEFGNVTPASEQKKIPYLNRTYAYSLAGGTTTTTFNPLSLETQRSFLASDQDTSFMLNRIGGRCAGEGDYTYGVAFATVSKGSQSIKWSYLKRGLENNSTPTVTSDFCDRKIGDKTVALDLTMSDLTINDEASSSVYTAAWMSNVSGDSEIYIMDVTAAESKVFNISDNRKP